MIYRIKESSMLFPLLITTIYLLSRFVFFVSGIKFDVSSLDYFFQYLDINILQDNLINGVYYQHSQPPLFNIFLGVVLKLFPVNYEYVFAIFFYFCGLTTYFLIYKILCLVRFNSWTAFGVATIFVIFPEAILYENWLFYTWPVATLLTFAAYELLLYEKTLRLQNGVLFLIAISTVCLTRSMFHLVYLALCIMLVLWIPSANRKIIGIVSISVLLLVGSMFIKNYALFGFFGSSSWIGMNLWKITKNLEVSKLVADSEVTSVEPFSPISMYPGKYRKVPITYSKIPGLTAEYRQSGKVNFNHYGYIAISNEYLKESLNFILNDFTGYLKKVVLAFSVYSRPAWYYYPVLDDNREKIQGYIDFISFAKPRSYIERELLRIKIGRKYPYPISSILVIPAALTFIVVFFAVDSIKFIRKSACFQQRVFFSFMVLTILYVTVLSIGFDYAENNRFRVQTDPLLYLATIISIREVWSTFQNKIQNRLFSR